MKLKIDLPKCFHMLNKPMGLEASTVEPKIYQSNPRFTICLQDLIAFGGYLCTLHFAASRSLGDT